MTIYQGESRNVMLLHKDSKTGGFYPSLDGKTIEIMLVNDRRQTVGEWSTENGTVIIKQKEREGKMYGLAEFKIDGSLSASLRSGLYNLEFSVEEGGKKAISSIHEFLEIVANNIKNGIQ